MITIPKGTKFQWYVSSLFQADDVADEDMFVVEYDFPGLDKSWCAFEHQDGVVLVHASQMPQAPVVASVEGTAKVFNARTRQEVERRHYELWRRAELNLDGDEYRRRVRQLDQMRANTLAMIEIKEESTTTPDDKDKGWMDSDTEIALTLGIPVGAFVSESSAPAPAAKEGGDSPASSYQAPATDPPARGAQRQRDVRVIEKDGHEFAIVPSESGVGEYRVALSDGFDDVPEPMSCTCKHWVMRLQRAHDLAARCNESIRVVACKHMERARMVLMELHRTGLYQSVMAEVA